MSKEWGGGGRSDFGFSLLLIVVIDEVREVVWWL